MADFKLAQQLKAYGPLNEEIFTITQEVIAGPWEGKLNKQWLADSFHIFMGAVYEKAKITSLTYSLSEDTKDRIISQEYMMLLIPHLFLNANKKYLLSNSSDDWKDLNDISKLTWSTSKPELYFSDKKYLAFYSSQENSVHAQKYFLKLAKTGRDLFETSWLGAAVDWLNTSDKFKLHIEKKDILNYRDRLSKAQLV